MIIYYPPKLESRSTSDCGALPQRPPSFASAASARARTRNPTPTPATALTLAPARSFLARARPAVVASRLCWRKAIPDGKSKVHDARDNTKPSQMKNATPAAVASLTVSTMSFFSSAILPSRALSFDCNLDLGLHLSSSHETVVLVVQAGGAMLERPWRPSTEAVLTREEAEAAVVATMSQKKANKRAKMVLVSFILTKQRRRGKKI